MPTDPRIAPVEENIVYFVERVCRVGPDWVMDRSGSFALAYSSEVAFPLFNVVAGAGVDADDPAGVSKPARTIVSEFTARGVPWMWWTTPSHTSLALEDTLTSSGLVAECVPGMYADLENLPDREDGIETREVLVDDPGWGDVFIRGFGLPELVRDPIGGLLDSFTTDEQVLIVALDQGIPAGVASGLVTGETMGIYNVATLPEHRGRGIGSAVTRAVMQAGLDRGCRNAILHTSAMGRGVYERLGFEVVCPTTHWVWMPPETIRGHT